MPDFKIKCFSEYVLRTPLFPLSVYLKLIDNYSSKKAIALYNDSIVKEAIKLASPELVNELDKWASGIAISNEKNTALELTFLKYLSRMTSRCTPFGLFAGCSVGNLGSETNVIVNEINKHKRFTQLDMQYWVAMLQDIAKRAEVVPHLQYFPNSSIYEIGYFYRFIEYKYVKTQREHTISALRKSEFLEEILLQAKSGITIDEMILFLANDQSEKEDARAFILQLISFQFLISDLDAALTGNDEWKRMFSILYTIPFFKKETQLFENLKEKLSELDKTLIPSNKVYKNIKLLIDKIGTDYEEKHLFQTDLNISTSQNNLNTNISVEVLKAIRFLNGIQTHKESKNLENFKKAFLHRYESKEMPLTTVLDTEIGIGYLQNHDMNDTHEILENFSFTSNQSKEKNQSWTTFDFVLQKKLHDCIFNQEKEIILSEKDFPDFDDNDRNTPATFSTIIEVAGDENIALTSSGNISASKLLGRFCNGNNEIYALTKQIIAKENEYHSDKILAEIVHIPKSRAGNILKRPAFRKHEISYLCIPGVSKDGKLDLTDLWISIQHDRIVLRSKKHNKEILPCLSNAHNFTNNSLPIYHFLCDLGLQNAKPVHSFNWGVLTSHYIYFPRVTYNKIIISKVQWTIKNEEIIILSKINPNKLEDFLEWRLSRKIPRFANLIDFDNTLLFDFESQICIKLFLKSIKNKNEIILEEFLFNEKSIAQNSTRDNFCNQIILSYYKEKQ